MERTMLSPHEFATLLLVKDAPDQADMDRDELDALLEQQLVKLEALGSGRKYCVTEIGDAALRSIKLRYS
ncbi:phage tail assembly chaperone [Burkholderia thailandensis]|nr:phage tail assembly chaperone [Burkholderia thailandensis]